MPEQTLRFHEAYSHRMIVSCGVGAELLKDCSTASNAYESAAVAAREKRKRNAH